MRVFEIYHGGRFFLHTEGSVGLQTLWLPLYRRLIVMFTTKQDSMCWDLRGVKESNFSLEVRLHNLLVTSIAPIY